MKAALSGAGVAALFDARQALPVATIRAESPRAERWRELFGGEEVPITSPISDLTRDGETVVEIYFCDVQRLTPEQIERVVAHIAATYNLPEEEVRADLLGEHGLPLLAADLAVTFDGRALL